MTRQPTFEGKPCKRCQSTIRFVASRRCAACKNSGDRARKERRKADPTLAEQDREYFKQRYLNQKPEFQQYYIQRKYGLTAEQHAEMVEDAKGSCAICKQEPERGLVVDHCHTTGQVRGLLCGSCNVALGLMRDNPDYLASAINYLTSYGCGVRGE